MTDGHRYGVDHGLTFHVDHKLRTVLWGWLGRAAARGGAAGCTPRAVPRWAATSATCSAEHVTGGEIEAFGRRCQALLAADELPVPARRVAGHSLAAILRPDRLPGMRSWSSPEVPDLTVTGPAVRIHDTSTGELVETRPGRPGPALRLRHHAVRRDPHGPRRDLPRLRPPQPGLAQRRARGGLRPERHRRRRPAARAGDEGQGRLGGAGRARDRAVPAGHGGAARPGARPLHRCRRVDPARHRPDHPAAGGRRDLPGRDRPLLLRDRRRRTSVACPAGRATRCCGSSASVGETPTARASATRSTASCGAASARASRRGTAPSVPAGRAGTSSAPRSRSSTSAPPSTSRAAAAT